MGNDEDNTLFVPFTTLIQYTSTTFNPVEDNKLRVFSYKHNLRDHVYKVTFNAFGFELFIPDTYEEYLTLWDEFNSSIR